MLDQADLPPWDQSPSLDVFHAAVDRLIPGDDYPGAWDANVFSYVAGQLDGDARADLPLIAAGLAALDAEAHEYYSLPFASLDPARQDEVLAAVEKGAVRTSWSVAPTAFFTLLLNLTNEGYYGDSGSGGPEGPLSWQMIGYRPGPAPLRGTA